MATVPRRVTVIGGGVSGLAAAGLLSRNGLRVTLFEANDKLGGCCATTRLHGYTFNDGALYLALPGVLDHVFEQLGADRPSLLPLRRITACQATRLPDGTVVTVADGPRIGVSNPHRPVDAATVQRDLGQLLARWEPVFRLFSDDLMLGPFSPSHLVLRGWRQLPKLRGTLAAELKRSFRDPAVRAALSGTLLHTGLSPARAPVVSILGLVALLAEGLYLPEGGMGAIPAALSHCLEANGCEVVRNAAVRRIVVRGGRVRGVDVEGHGVVEADAVLLAVSGMATFRSLLDEADVPLAMKRKVERATLSHRALALQLGVSTPLTGCSHMNGVLPLMDEQDQVFTLQEGQVRWPVYSVPTVTMPELAPPGGSIVEMFPPIDQRLPADSWDREEEEKVVTAAIESLTRLHDLKTTTQRVLSPRGFQDRLHLYGGAIYGLSPATSPRALFPHTPPIPGLYLAGQTTYPGYGVAAAAVSGLFAAEALQRS